MAITSNFWQTLVSYGLNAIVRTIIFPQCGGNESAIGGEELCEQGQD